MSAELSSKVAGRAEMSLKRRRTAKVAEVGDVKVSKRGKATSQGDTDIWRRWGAAKDAAPTRRCGGDVSVWTGLPTPDVSPGVLLLEGGEREAVHGTTTTACTLPSTSSIPQPEPEPEPNLTNLPQPSTTDPTNTRSPLTTTTTRATTTTIPPHTTRTTIPPTSNLNPADDANDPPKSLTSIRARIATDPSLTPFRAHVLTLLTQVPRGRYTTYKALAAAVPLTVPPRASKSTFSKATSKFTPKSISKPTPTIPQTPSSITSPSTTHLLPTPPPLSAPPTCARAVGNAMRNNPFAPEVPCHRVLAADGSIGGFGGEWGEEGRFAGEKRGLLGGEGVVFDGRGRAVGEVFVGFV